MLYLFLFILGLAIGSFLNVLIDRLPSEESIMGRSHCDHCKTKLTWIDLLPVVSYIYLGGKCRTCKKNLSFFYPFIEFLTALTFLFVATRVQIPLSGTSADSLDFMLSLHVDFLKIFSLLGIVSVFIVIFFTDLKYQVIPESVELVFFAFSFLYLFAVGITPKIFFDHALSALLVASPILLLYLITKAKGMGFGDVELAFNVGFLLGIIPGLFALYLAFILGGGIGLFMVIFQKVKMRSKIAFGPFIILGTFIIFFWQQELFRILHTFYPF